MATTHAEIATLAEPSADLATASAETLAELFPSLGLFAAEDVVAWRDTHEGFPDEQTLVSLGLAPELAAEVTDVFRSLDAASPRRTSATYAAGSVIDFSDDPPVVAAIAANTERLSAAALIERLPQLGAFTAEDIVDWRATYGEFPDEETLVSVMGLQRSLATQVVRSLGSVTPDEAGAAEPAHMEEVIEADSYATLDDAQRHDPLSLAPPPPPLPPPSTVPPRRVTPPPLPPEVRAEAPPPEVRAEAPQESVESAPSTAPAEASTSPRPTTSPPEAAPAKSAPQAHPAPRRRTVAALIGALFVVNAGVVVGLFQTRSEERRAVAPIVAISADVKDLKADRAETRTELAETRAKLDETRRSLAKQESVLLGTIDAVNQNDVRQTNTERALKELEGRESRDVAALASRMRLVEKRAADGAYTLSLGEAVQLIDAVQGPAQRGPTGNGNRESAPRTKTENVAPPKAHEPHIDW